MPPRARRGGKARDAAAPAGGGRAKGKAGAQQASAAADAAYLRDTGYYEMVQRLGAEMARRRPGCVAAACCEWFAEQAAAAAACKRTKAVWQAVGALAVQADRLGSDAEDEGTRGATPDSYELEYTAKEDDFISFRTEGGKLYFCDRGGSEEESERHVDRLVYRAATRRGQLGLDVEFTDAGTDSDGCAAADLPIKRAPFLIPRIVALADRCGVRIAGKTALLEHGAGDGWGVACVMSWAAEKLRREMRKCRKHEDVDEDDDGSEYEDSSDPEDVRPGAETEAGKQLASRMFGRHTNLLLTAVVDSPTKGEQLMAIHPWLCAVAQAQSLRWRPDLRVSHVYVEGRQLGRGSFATVKEARMRLRDPELPNACVAVKRSDTDDAALVECPGPVCVGSKVRAPVSAFPDLLPNEDCGDATATPLSGTVWWIGRRPGSGESAGEWAAVELDIAHFCTADGDARRRRDAAAEPRAAGPVPDPGGRWRRHWALRRDLARVAPREVAMMERIGPHPRVLALVDWRAGRYAHRLVHDVHHTVLRRVVADRLAALRGGGCTDAALAAVAAEVAARARAESEAAPGEDGDESEVVLQLARGGDLAANLQRLQRLFLAGGGGRGVVRAVMRQAAEGLAAVHAAGVVHHDIKPDAFLLLDPLPSASQIPAPPPPVAVAVPAPTGVVDPVMVDPVMFDPLALDAVAQLPPPPPVAAAAVADVVRETGAAPAELVRVVLADFGASKLEGTAEVNAAAPDYRAPELLCARDVWKGEADVDALAAALRRPAAALPGRDGTAYGRPADVWALGCVFYRLVTAARAFPQEWDTSAERIAHQQAGPAFTEPQWAAAPGAEALVRRMLSVDAAARPAAADIAGDAFFSDPAVVADPR